MCKNIQVCTLTWWFENLCCSLRRILWFLQVLESPGSVGCERHGREWALWGSGYILSTCRNTRWEISPGFRRSGARFPPVWTGTWAATRWWPYGSLSWTLWTASPRFCSACTPRTVRRTPARKTHQLVRPSDFLLGDFGGWPCLCCHLYQRRYNHMTQDTDLTEVLTETTVDYSMCCPFFRSNVTPLLTITHAP